MRYLLICLLAVVTASAADLKIAHVVPGYRDAASFERISEFFSGKENPSGQQLLRTQTDVRDGFYFLTRLKNSGQPTTANVELQVITPESPKPHVYKFPATALRSGTQVLQLGVTGTDWLDDKAQPVAWRIDFYTPDGQPLTHEQSFLWSIDPR